MAFCLGSLNEAKKDLKKAIKFYKRFYFCARILEDPVGASLALNRLGVAYHKLPAANYKKSLLFHEKHLEQTDKENIFASYYNIGIIQRIEGSYEKSVKSFTQALAWASSN